MNSALFNSWGLGQIDPAILFLSLAGLTLIVLILLIVLLVKYSQLKKRYNIFMKGKKAESLEDDLQKAFLDMQMLKTGVDRNKKDIRQLYKRMETTFQKVGIVRYNALPNLGGQLSVALALLDENNDGFVMNSVYGNEGSYTYIKQITEGESAITLGKEEQQALNMAIGE